MDKMLILVLFLVLPTTNGQSGNIKSLINQCKCCEICLEKQEKEQIDRTLSEKDIYNFDQIEMVEKARDSLVNFTNLHKDKSKQISGKSETYIQPEVNKRVGSDYFKSSSSTFKTKFNNQFQKLHKTVKIIYANKHQRQEESSADNSVVKIPDDNESNTIAGVRDADYLPQDGKHAETNAANNSIGTCNRPDDNERDSIGDVRGIDFSPQDGNHAHTYSVDNSIDHIPDENESDSGVRDVDFLPQDGKHAKTDSVDNSIEHIPDEKKSDSSVRDVDFLPQDGKHAETDSVDNSVDHIPQDVKPAHTDSVDNSTGDKPNHNESDPNGDVRFIDYLPQDGKHAHTDSANNSIGNKPDDNRGDSICNVRDVEFLQQDGKHAHTYSADKSIQFGKKEDGIKDNGEYTGPGNVVFKTFWNKTTTVVDKLQDFEGTLYERLDFISEHWVSLTELIANKATSGLVLCVEVSCFCVGKLCTYITYIIQSIVFCLIWMIAKMFWILIWLSSFLLMILLALPLTIISFLFDTFVNNVIFPTIEVMIVVLTLVLLILILNYLFIYSFLPKPTEKKIYQGRCSRCGYWFQFYGQQGICPFCGPFSFVYVY